jgi:predicted phosphodiesterase
MRILVVGDTHEPASHPMYRRFCKDMYDKYGCQAAVHIGDVVDWHAISFHAKHPELPGPKDEHKLALERVRCWRKAFPQLRVCIGNHDRRPARLAETTSIPEYFLKSYNEIWKTPKWKWNYEYIIDGVNYYHGEGCGGINPAYTRARGSSVSIVIGHCHSAAGVKWIADKSARRFGMDVGCGLDVDRFQFAYGKHLQNRPILGVGIVIDGVPHHIIMPCGPGEKYHKRNANKLSH